MNKSPLPDGWSISAQNAWLINNKNDAIQIVLSEINKSRDKPIALVFQASYYFYLINDYRSALTILKHQLTGNNEKNIQLLTNIAVCYGRLNEHENAVQYAKRCIEIEPENYVSYDTLAANYYRLQQFEDAAFAGRRSLYIKDSLIKTLSSEWVLPSQTPSNFVQKTYKKNIISFSLWGDNPRYLRGAIRNLLLLPEFFPGWFARFYIDETVPREFCDLLYDFSAEVIVQPSTNSIKNKLCWRFLVSDDPSVGYFLIRDTDSVFSVRESIAVHQWIKSGKWFHIIRDWWTHTDLILAGMWGGVAGVLPSFSEMIREYSPSNVETPNVDQWFLRDCVWAYIRVSSLVHDRFFGTSEDTQCLPEIYLSENHHIGQNEFIERYSEQEKFIHAWIEKYPCLT